MTNQESDINQVIASAVNARVEAAVAQALADPNTMGTFVQAALQQPVEERNSRERTTTLNHLLRATIVEKTKAVVSEEIEAQSDVIRMEVRAALGKSLGVITDSLVDGFIAQSSGRYPSIEVKFGG